MRIFQQAACPEVVQKVEAFLKAHDLAPGSVDAHTLLQSDVYVAWNKAAPARNALHSRVISFDTGAQAEQAVQLLTTPNPQVG
jgi:hypothetical protein